MSKDIIYRCRDCYKVLSIPYQFMGKDIDKDDGWLRATGCVNVDYYCLECQIKNRNIKEMAEKAWVYDKLNK